MSKKSNTSKRYTAEFKRDAVALVHSSGKTVTEVAREIGVSPLKQALTEAAWGAARAKGTYLAAHHAQIRGRAGRYKAIGATRHDIIVAYWHIAHDRVPFRELGADWVSRRYSPEHRARRLIAQLEELGLSVTTKPAE
ncbi:transposase [Streptomyces sp. NPDC004008]